MAGSVACNNAWIVLKWGKAKNGGQGPVLRGGVVSVFLRGSVLFVSVTTVVKLSVN